MQNKDVNFSEVSDFVKIFIIADVTGWQVEYIRSLSSNFVKIFYPMCELKFRRDCQGL